MERVDPQTAIEQIVGRYEDIIEADLGARIEDGSALLHGTAIVFLTKNETGLYRASRTSDDVAEELLRQRGVLGTNFGIAMIGEGSTFGIGCTFGDVTIANNVSFGNNVKVGDSSRFEVGTTVSSDVQIGESANVRSQVQIYNDFVAGSQLFVGTRAIVADRITCGDSVRILAGAEVGSHVRIWDDITIGQVAEVGAGAWVLANVPDERPVKPGHIVVPPGMHIHRSVLHLLGGDN